MGKNPLGRGRHCEFNKGIAKNQTKSAIRQWVNGSMLVIVFASLDLNLIKEMLHQTKSADCVAMLKFVFLGQVASFLGEIVLRLCCRTTLQ